VSTYELPLSEKECWLRGPLPDMSDLGDVVTLNTIELNHGNCFVLLNSWVLTEPLPKVRTNIAQLGTGPLGRGSVRSQREIDLEIRVVGHVNPAGVPYADAHAGCDQNVELLQAYTIDAAEGSDGALPITLVRKNGEVWTNRIQIDDWTTDEDISTDARIVELACTLIRPWTPTP
jgi:hypothetical protein